MIKKCIVCKKDFRTFPYYVKQGQGRFCSSKCYGTTLTDHIPWNKGKKMSKKYRQTVSNTMRGKTGILARRWKGGRFALKTGSIMIMADNKKYIPEHRYVIEKHIGRPLTKFEIVHHVNRNKSDNRIENLQIMSRAEHASHHHPSNHNY